MPHHCTNCGRRFPDGSKEMLSGCPDCGGNRFQFVPGERSERESESETKREPDAPSEHRERSNESDSFSEWPETARAPEEPADSRETEESEWPAVASEDEAQADARRAVVEPEDLPEANEEPADRPDHGRVVSEPDEENPSVDELRTRLNEQFESIKILEPGQYELNLMELYDRDEHIVSLEEDGRYVIDVPGSWTDADE